MSTKTERVHYAALTSTQGTTVAACYWGRNDDERAVVTGEEKARPLFEGGMPTHINCVECLAWLAKNSPIIQWPASMPAYVPGVGTLPALLGDAPWAPVEPAQPWTLREKAWVEWAEKLTGLPGANVSDESLREGLEVVLNCPGTISLARIAIERQRQTNVEGWTPEHDDEHEDGDMATAGACYALDPGRRPMGLFMDTDEEVPESWPWDPEYWKPSPDDRRRELVKAGALIVAELDRMDRSEEPSGLGELDVVTRTVPRPYQRYMAPEDGDVPWMGSAEGGEE